ncbi:hypothetical protein QET93_007765 [Akkermansia sp. N21116]|uniref:hypothetical protein n=1 Tax=Akkermansia sp. N21116 TaxID=3040764 RepID=UPI00244EB149|nr:hypothetical protein [Akkermansia sp. N21116]WPX39432.1 hypothetical protein QET93_007765 [Akkermansia sp. N21116]
MALMASERIQKLKERLEELQTDKSDVKQAIKTILSGKAQSYGVGTRNKSAYNMSLGELRAYLREIESEINGIERELGGYGRRTLMGFVPKDF